ncbi:universal stress protein [Halobacterium noricense]|nr:universal stress protein [Halobacterium noricense]
MTELVTEGAKLANAFDEELEVVHVMKRETFRELEEESVEETGKTVSLDNVRAMAREISSDAIEDADVDGTAVGLVGKPADEIVKYATKHDASYLVVGGRKRSAVGKAIFGSVTQSILLDAESPVVAVMGD